MQKLDGCITTTAVNTDVIISNIKKNNKLNLTNVANSDGWRQNTPIAIVGGGPSLKYTLKELTAFKYIMSCGSVHDFLVKNNVLANWCALCDPDPLIIKYLQLLQADTKYLTASQCHPDVFGHIFARADIKNYIWHAYGDKFPIENFGENQPIVGGGCTIGTRAMILAYGMGFTNQHLFGMDTCLGDDKNHHCYEYATKEENIGNILEIHCGDLENGKKFMMADYMLAQLFDFKMILKTLGDKIKFTVHGGGVLDYTIKYNIEKGI